MSIAFRAFCLCASLAVVSPSAAGAASDVALSRLARDQGYTFAWIDTESAATLARPGVAILVRAGNPRYEVNDAVGYLSDVPQLRGNELYVDAALAHQLAQLAAAHPWPVLAQRAPGGTPPAGTVSVSAHYRSGTQTVEIAGRGPAGAMVTIVLTGEIARDLPVVSLDRTQVTAGADGAFFALVPAGSLSFPRSMLGATATAGTSSASVRLGLQEPDDAFSSPNNSLPPDK